MVFPKIIGRRMIPHPDRMNGGRKRCLYFDPYGTRAAFVDMSITNSRRSGDQFALLELLGPFRGGRELVRGCRVCVTQHQRRHYYMVYTKYRRSQENVSVREESRGQESWNGPVVVMRLDTRSATRLVSMTNKVHRELAIRAIARYAEHMNPQISTASAQRKRISWPWYL